MSCPSVKNPPLRDRNVPLILVVENDLENRNKLTRRLEEQGYSTIVIDQRSSCLEQISQFSPDLILLGDFRDCEILRDRVPHIPILVMIQPEDSDKIVEAFVAGATDCLIKPIRWEVLHYQMQRFIARLSVEPLPHSYYLKSEHNLEKFTLDLQKKLQLEQKLHLIIEKVRDALDEHLIMNTTLQELTSALSATCSYSTLYHPQKCYRFGIEDDLEVPRIELNAELQNQLQKGELIRFDFSSAQFSSQVGFAYPLISRQGENLGYVGILVEPEKSLTEPEKYLLKQVVRHCTAALILSRIHQKAQHKIEQLEQTLQDQEEFLNIVAHELRSPIANISFITEMLESSLKQHPKLFSEEDSTLSTKRLNYLKILQEECDREIALVNDLLDLQRLELRKTPAQPDQIYLDYWLTNLIEPFAERMQQRQQKLIIKIDSPLPPLLCDPISLERMISELLHNACKYTPPTETITVEATATPEQIQIQISNTGVEFSETELHRMFEKFYRIPQSDRWKQGGTGLGLALVKKLIEQLGGFIQVQNPNQTLIFTLSFPLISCPIL